MECENWKNCVNFKEKEKVIYVPEEIQFTNSFPPAKLGMGLLFNNGKQELYWNKNLKIFKVEESCTQIIKPKLFLCEKGDIDVGEWGFANDFEDGDFKERGHYFLNIGETTIGKPFICILDDAFIQPVKFSYNYWWKVAE